MKSSASGDAGLEKVGEISREVFRKVIIHCLILVYCCCESWEARDLLLLTRWFGAGLDVTVLPRNCLLRHRVTPRQLILIRIPAKDSTRSQSHITQQICSVQYSAFLIDLQALIPKALLEKKKSHAFSLNMCFS